MGRLHLPTSDENAATMTERVKIVMRMLLVAVVVVVVVVKTLMLMLLMLMLMLLMMMMMMMICIRWCLRRNLMSRTVCCLSTLWPKPLNPKNKTSKNP